MLLEKMIHGKIEISKTEYIKLLKQEERLEAIIRYVEVSDYLDKKAIEAIIGAIPKRGDKNE